MPGEVLSPQNRRLPSLALPAGERIVDQPAIKDRLADVHDPMMQHALVETWGRDHPLLGIPDQELLKSTDRERPLANGFRHGRDALIKARRELSHHRLPPSPAGGFMEGQPQILWLGNLIKQVRRSTHPGGPPG